MIKRKPLAPNNRQAFMSEFLSSLESVASPIRHPKVQEASVFHYARAGRQNSQGFGGGNRITK